MLDKNSKIYIPGHKGFVGSRLLLNLQGNSFTKLITRSRKELDLFNQKAVTDFFEAEKPDCVILCAAKVGGILPNSTKPAEFLYENLQIQNNIIHQAYRTGVKKLIFLASSCVYPRNCPQPMKEEYLFQGDFEPTNYGYAVAKAAGIKMCQAYNEQYGTNFVAINPSNLYGPGDHFGEDAHALASIIRKAHIAKTNNDNTIPLWGTGIACREWLFVDDLADIIRQIMLSENISENFLNVGYGQDLNMLELTKTILKVVGHEARIELDSSKPDGMPRKLVDTSKMSKYNLKASTDLEEGIAKTYKWFLENAA